MSKDKSGVHHTPEDPLYVVDDTGKIKWKGEAGGKPRPIRFSFWVKVALSIVGFILLYRYILQPFFESGFGMEDTRAVPGDASNFEPFNALPEIRSYAGEDVLLIEITLSYVRSDGTMELTASYTPAPEAEYEFMRQIPRPDNAPPIGAGGANNEPWYEPITITAYQPGKWWHVTTGSTEYSYMNKGMDRETSSPRNGLSSPVLDDPRCSLDKLWAVALKQEVPSSAVATIHYNQYGYEFEISGTDVDLTFDFDCTLKNS